LNRRHKDFQSSALPTELPGPYCNRFLLNRRRDFSFGRATLRHP
jgi:hypothetical protein